MAQHVTISLIDDLDGKSEATQTVTFALDGVGYEIDLSEKNADKLRSVLGKYIDAGRRVGKNAAKPKAKAAKSSRGSNAAEVRAWAVSEGLLADGSRGRIPTDVLTAFEANN